jgi:hypothetical protein
MGGDGQQDPQYTHSSHHRALVDLLPQYVAVVLGGDDPAARYPEIAAHLAGCSSCAADLVELMNLAVAAYIDQDSPPPAYPTPILSGLSRPAAIDPRKLWRIDDLGRMLLEISAVLLARARPSPLVGLARADDLLYDLNLPAEGSATPELRLEVFHEDRAAATVRVRVTVELPGQDVFDAAGTQVALVASGEPPAEWHAVTDAVGSASFSGVPRQALAGLRIAIRAARSA